MREGWKYISFEEGLEKVTKTSKIASSDYKEKGTYPIVSQEETLISGFWDNYDDVCKIQHPVVIFGDHTRIIKFIDFNFVVGADGVKILSPKSNIDPKFFYYYLRWCNIPSLGYSRHYKLLKELQIPVPSLPEQERTVAELDLLTGIIDRQKAQLQELDTLAQSIFYDMFGEVDINNKQWKSVEVGDVFYSIKNGANIKQTKGAKGLPITRIETLSGGVFNRNRLGYADIFDAQKYSKYVLDDGDILMSHINSKAYIGRSVVYKKEDREIIIHGMNLLRLKPIPSILNSAYAKFLFDTFFFKKQVASIRKDAVNQSSIAVGDIIKLIMRLPPIEIQDTFAQKIQSIESQKASINQSIAETQKLFDYTMDKYFG